MGQKKEPSLFVKLKPWVYLYPHALTGTELKVMLALCFNMSWGTNKIMLDPPMLQILCDRLDMRKDYFMRVIGNLEKKEMIKKDGWYYVIRDDFASKG